MVTFLFGGLTGVLLASPPIDFHVVRHATSWSRTSTTCCSARSCSPSFAGIYFWFPKFTGRYLDERLGKLHFWLTFIGFHLTFLVQHWLGAEGMPRRYADYLPTDGFTTLNTISTIGSFVLGRVDAAVPLQRLPVLPLRRDRHRRRPVGPRQLPGVGHLQPAAAAQLHLHPAHPLRAPGVRGHYPHLLERLETEAHAGNRAHRAVTSMDGRDPDEGAHVGSWGIPLDSESPSSGSGEGRRS